jgi:hypothetical protein
MALAARQAMGKKQLKAYADRGYFMGPEIKCPRRPNFDPPCRLNFDPGLVAGIA